MKLGKNQTILFQGDSVTDCGRVGQEPEHWGGGYAMMIASWLSARHPAQGWTFHNRGISGNRTCDLLARWDADCIALRPDWVSILIGINNLWRRYDSGNPTPCDLFEAEYRALLERTRKETRARLVLCEPFLLPYPEDRKAWREDLDPKLAVVRALARDYDAVLVRLDRIFARASRAHPPQFWAADGVHPTRSGHALIAQSWLRAVGAIE